MFDLSKRYSAEIAPLVQELKEKCYALGMPMFFCAAVAENENETSYRNEMLSAEIVRQNLKDDRIAKMVNVVMGYDVVMSSKPQEIEFSVEDGEDETINGVFIKTEDE